MGYKGLSLLFSLVLAGIILFLHPLQASAFTANNLMDDRVFDNANAMSATQIDVWLNTNFPVSCISQNNGFSAADVTGYNKTQGYLYGTAVSAGQVIYNAAQAYGINPQVLLTTLQKEQGLVSGTAGCGTLAYVGAMGYGCPDGGTIHSYPTEGTPPTALYYLWGSPVTSVSGTCVNTASKVGFSEQVIHAAWLLAFNRQRSEGNTNWAIIKGSWDNSDDPPSCYLYSMTQGYRARSNSPTGCGGTQDNVAIYYDGLYTIDSTSVHFDTGATASLYVYTPHFGGNQNFDNIFIGWFGSLYQIYTWAIVSQSAYTDSTKTTPVDLGKLGPSQRYYLGLSLQNTGNVTWTKGGINPVDLGTANPRDGVSLFCDPTWPNPSPGCNRLATLNEWSVAPGQIGSFGFWITTPSTPSTYNNIYAPVVEGITWMDNHTASFPMIVNPPAYTWSLFNQTVYTDSSKQIAVDSANLVAGQHYYDVISIKNTGNILWQKQGANPTKLGTSNPQDRPSSMCEPSWLSCNRPAPLHEWSVAPGQVGSFEFWIKIPTSGTYTENFTPFLEGLIWMNSPTAVLTGTVSPATYSWDLISQFTYTDSTKTTPVNMGQLTAGGRYYIGFSLKNTGNTIWHQNSSNPLDLGAASTTQVDLQGKYCDTTWPSGSPGCNRPAYLHEPTVAPGQIGSFEFWITAPTTAGSYNDTYAPLMEGITWINYHTVSFPSIVR